MKEARDQVTGVRLYHWKCGRALWVMSDSFYLWCDKCQEDMGWAGPGVNLGRLTKEDVKAWREEMEQQKRDAQ